MWGVWVGEVGVESHRDSKYNLNITEPWEPSRLVSEWECYS